MGQAKRRRAGLQWRGRAPDALFVRHVEEEREYNLPLIGTLHVLTPGDPLAIASKVADHLRWPDKVPSAEEKLGFMPLWQDAREQSHASELGLGGFLRALRSQPAEVEVEIKRKLDGCPVVLVTMVADSEEQCTFVYDDLPEHQARHLNGILAEGLWERPH
jgi:hypothetical protein